MSNKYPIKAALFSYDESQPWRKYDERVDKHNPNEPKIFYNEDFVKWLVITDEPLSDLIREYEELTEEE